jgi:peptidoglycan/LPS O-acetylase OafA/YrhL
MDSEASMTEAPARRPFLEYWPEVDGLRSIAVLAVFVFHFNRGWLGGGFVGVDIFYVISGFLITAILLQDVDRGSFSIARFYQRRISRIAPAFFLVLVATLIAAWLIYSAQDFASAGAASAFAAISLVNIKFMLMGDYFTVSPDAQPFLHYWSLAVEEQFYVFFPFYLYAVTRWTKRPVAITLVLLTLSLLLCIGMTYTRPVYAFYLLPTRGWELMAGAVVTMLRWRGVRPGAAMLRWLPWAGLALVLLSVLLLREGPHFPGAVALLPVLGTAAILACAGDPRPALNRVLGHALPVFIGKRSYSLYLWHWPVFSMVDYQLFAADGWTRGALKIGITLAATWLSYTLVERPARRFLNQPPRRMLAYGFFAVAVAATFAAGTMIRNAWFFDAKPASIAGGGIVAAHGSRGNIVLIGDSQSTMYARDLGILAQAKGYSLHALGVADGEQLPGQPRSMWPSVWSYVAGNRVDLVIISEAWSTKLVDPAPLKAAIDQLAARGIRVMLVQEIASPIASATREGIRAGARAPFAEEPAFAVKRERARALVQSLAAPGVTVIDPWSLFHRPDGSIDVIGDHGRENYQDSHHLSDTGARRAIPMFDGAIDAALKR